MMSSAHKRFERRGRMVERMANTTIILFAIIKFILVLAIVGGITWGVVTLFKATQHPGGVKGALTEIWEGSEE